MAFCAWCGTPVAVASYAACPRCGSPSNGAVRTAPPPSGNKTALIVVGAIVALPVFVAIAGIVAAIAIPNLLTALQSSRQKRAMAEMRVIASAVASHVEASDGRYPQELTGENLPRVDPWGTPYRYECWPAGACTSYALGSAGADQTFEQESLQSYAPRGTSSFDDDLVMADGKFVRHPEGRVR